jgi:hypothetical protein
MTIATTAITTVLTKTTIPFTDPTASGVSTTTVGPGTDLR